MLLPALNKAREKARAISCTNNQKQALLAMAMYADSHNGNFICISNNAADTPSNKTNGTFVPWYERLRLAGLVNDDMKIGRCPSIAVAKTAIDDVAAHCQDTYAMPRLVNTWKTYYGNGVGNVSGSTANNELKINLYDMAGPRMIMIDSYNTAISSQIFEWSPIGAAGNNLATFIHGDRANVGWSDGHVESMVAKAVETELKDVGGMTTFNYYDSSLTAK